MPRKKKQKEAEPTPEQEIGEKVNPAFVECIQSLIDEQKKKTKNSFTDKLLITYNKALKSVKRYPLKLYSAQDARILEGVGPVLVSKMDQFLQENYPNLILEKPSTEEDSEQDVNTQPEIESPQSSSSTASVNKNYVPKFKSAGWAILITLYREWKQNRNQKLGKTEIIRKCSALTDTPMLPQGSSQSERFYSGWTSMKSTLIPKNLVEIKGRGKPHKFSLSSSGLKLAKKLYKSSKLLPDFTNEYANDTFVLSSDEEEEQAEEQSKQPKKSSKKRKEPPSSQQTSPNEQIDGNDDEIETDQQQQSQVDIHLTFEIFYVNGQGKRVFGKDEAKVKISVQDGLLFYCQITAHKNFEAYIKSIPQLFIVETIVASQSYTDHILAIGWAKDEICFDSSLDAKFIESIFKSDVISKYKPKPLGEMVQAKQSASTKQSKKKKKETSSSHQESSVTSSQQLKQHEEEDQRMDVFQFVNSANNSSTTSTSAVSLDNDQNATYEIVLLVDTRERQRGTGDRGAYLAQQLSKKNSSIKVEQSSLILGDFLWIIRWSNDKQNSYVMDYLIERKAMDDLASSIIDGRFKEQKFRLHQTHCKNVFYIVEGTDTKAQERLPCEALDSALANIQIHDKFFVRRTFTLDQSLDFLLTLHELIQKRCDTLSKNEIFEKYILKDHSDNTALTLKQYNAIYSKETENAVEIFGRQLCQIKGISPSFAMSILEQYKLPRLLFEKFEKVKQEQGVKEASELLVDLQSESAIRGISSKRKLGKSLSQFLFEFYTNNKY